LDKKIFRIADRGMRNKERYAKCFLKGEGIIHEWM
jgi:hypothetical protein